MRKVAIIGSTGVLGRKTVGILKKLQDQFRISALSCYNNTQLLLEQAEDIKPDHLCVMNSDHASMLPDHSLLAGAEGLVEIAKDSDYDIMFVSASGLTALKATFEALKRGKNVAIASKEIIVAGGKLLTDCARSSNALLIPVDSEHSAIFQLMRIVPRQELDNITICATGGPFINFIEEDLNTVTPAEALEHPVWKMGEKTTVDSATMINKSLEIIEASLLFDLPGEKIHVIIHPESLLHCMVKLASGYEIAFLEPPDMVCPVLRALLYPENICPDFQTDIFRETFTSMRFIKPHGLLEKSILMGYEALLKGHSACISLLAYDDFLTQEFFKGKILFPDIINFTDAGIKSHLPVKIQSVEHVLEIYDNEYERAKRMLR
jgi:1-deoxy-D-xylulose-5-phosphate reductoisomerase